MIILFGRYRFWRRIVGCRNDYCNACGKEVVAQQWRAFYFFHLFFIPLIPLGMYKRWECPDCHRNPRALYEIPRWIKITLVIIFGSIFIGLLFAPYTGDDAGVAWVFRGISLAMTALTAYALSKHHSNALINREHRRQVIPIYNNCPYCSGSLAHYPYLQCPRCKIKIFQD